MISTSPASVLDNQKLALRFAGILPVLATRKRVTNGARIELINLRIPSPPN
jgi:hypothetical protein